MAEFPNVDFAELPMTLEAEIPKEYIDIMGHLNVAWYTHFFSEAMLGLYGHLGFEVGELDEMRRGSFALETHIRYFREVRLSHKIEIFTRMIARNEKRFHIMCFMRNQTRNEFSASYEVVATSVNLQKRKPAPIPQDVGAAMDTMIAAHRLLDWDPPLCGVMGPR